MADRIGIEWLNHDLNRGLTGQQSPDFLISIPFGTGYYLAFFFSSLFFDISPLLMFFKLYCMASLDQLISVVFVLGVFLFSFYSPLVPREVPSYGPENFFLFVYFFLICIVYQLC
ncbi:hypothetical protein BDV38DRAFT_139179 [Aspergillus pseudotamarii]|uniref:Uncharacterized protein n=1 Tax=Aspergillus pseudotamarii TaxID=132259 RepID=A0A5N6SNF2_ASPPS|nr:uncharacterized protein BDV38DRAFT_139179 [Aspergillus pseudotamarii]KAE8135437.1 hypothetical protein BDV38DRAFT_139179 [Aspergillus pseudotamarii]